VIEHIQRSVIVEAEDEHLAIEYALEDMDQDDWHYDDGEVNAYLEDDDG
jgi:hypothetical protein